MKLRNKISVVILSICTIVLGGCGRILENTASDVQGWDISACVDGFDTCWELFRDNTDKFENGFEESLDEL